MRVIGGQYRSRTLAAPRGQQTRPTSDRLRETLFNVLAPRFEQTPGAVFLDLYAGSGAVGIEALSRGAREAIFVEEAEAPLRTIRANLASLDIRAGYSLEARSVATALKRLTAAGRSVDIVFLDPPYANAGEYERVLGLLGGEFAGLLAEGAVVVAEHLKKQELAKSFGALRRSRVLKQGDSGLSFYGVE